MARLLFYCLNGTGLGHVTRVLAVARQIRKLAPEHEILVLTSSENTNVLWREGIVSVKAPSYEAAKADERLPVAQLAHVLTSQVFATFRPHVAIVDSLAQGMFSELLSPLLIVPKRVFLFSMQPNYFSQAPYKIAIQYFDKIILPYGEDERAHIDVDFGDKGVWVGDILVRSADEILPRDTARRRLAPGAWKKNDVLAYVGLGGGGNPQNEDALAWILDTLLKFSGLEVACAVQPLSRQVDHIYERERCIPVSHFPMIEYFSAFDFAVSATGFNCGELVHAGVPAIWIPLGFPSTDQEFNADRFSNAGLGEKVELFNTDMLENAIGKMMKGKHRQDIRKRMQAWSIPNGAEGAAKAVLELLET